IFGVGLIQARLVSAASGLATLILTWALGRRLGGPQLGLLAAALLAVLRLNLAPFTGLTLTDLGATVRYDLIAVPYGLGACLLLLRRPVPGPGPLFLAGLLLGLASLTQFIGALFVLPLAVFVGALALPWKRRVVLAAIMAFGISLPVLPYATYAGAH